MQDALHSPAYRPDGSTSLPPSRVSGGSWPMRLHWARSSGKRTAIFSARHPDSAAYRIACGDLAAAPDWEAIKMMPPSKLSLK
ncbi:hypothetical protein AA106555_0746 [Neokomagataea thailandica NBRC 106555]|uniref:Uncharacterized protein n=1 Tax=Neokomagataea thailandica NBRC 106555 TaxID=1223520 RepID=A0ABQ0QP07_9PROT|nr:hypothetical protein AA106555_0746 [Neokomagataea thailandica NBRC 106555]